MQKNKFWLPDGKTLTLDAGSFISAIEYAASKNAILIGKPSPICFNMALKNINCLIEDSFIMIGDDIEIDIIAAQNLGGIGILINSGKTNFIQSKDFNFRPNYEAKNLAEAISILEDIIGNHQAGLL
jgi:ribonucleotide monophosphatase NagD (HAD superfamily)